MPLFPDLTTRRIRFMPFFMHVPSGLQLIDEFWDSRGINQDRARTVVCQYRRNGQPHTAFLDWEPAHKRCCNLGLGVQAGKASDLFPGLGIAAHSMKQKDFRDFFHEIRRIKVPGGVSANYGFTASVDIGKLLRPIPRITLTKANFDLYGKEDELVASLEVYDDGGEWTMVLKPEGTRPVDSSTVAADFFDSSYTEAEALAETLRSLGL